ncbi:c-type cytochrome [Rhodanobacter soli]|uniref:c-type cytochrome n=1 Tax=Rhodanobacter soli TaxID=590609 RepID=UPI0031CF72C2
MTKLLLRGAAVAGLCLGGALASPLAHAGNVAAGSDVFKAECAECHSVRAGRNKKGPSLFAVVGRAAGTLPGYNYSDALRAAHWTWTPEKLHGYLSQPAGKANPGTRMKYDGLADPRDLDDLVAYLGTLHP